MHGFAGGPHFIEIQSGLKALCQERVGTCDILGQTQRQTHRQIHRQTDKDRQRERERDCMLKSQHLTFELFTSNDTLKHGLISTSLCPTSARDGRIN